MTTTKVADAPAAEGLLADYLRVGVRGDLDGLAAYYAPTFTAVRTDLAGNTVRIDRAAMVTALHARAATSASMPPTDDVTVLASTDAGSTATVVFHRVKQGRPLIYTFVWDLAGVRPLLVHETTVELESRPAAG